MIRHLTSALLVVMVAGFAVLSYFVSPIFTDMLILVFMLGATYEMRKCLKDAGYDMYVAPAVIVLLCAYPAFYLMQHFIGGSAGMQGLFIVLLIAFMTCLSIFTFKPSYLNRKVKKVENVSSSGEEKVEILTDAAESSSETPVSPSENAAVCEIDYHELKHLFANIFVVVYPALFLTVAWVLSYKYSALFAIMFAIFVPIVGSDMFAFFFGKAIGGKKLCPSISPKKTVAGAVGGLIGGMVLAIVFWVIFEYVGSVAPVFAEGCNYKPFISHSDSGWMWKSALIYLAIGLVCGAISELGDLAASSIKRSLGIKDYGKIFPGHGGFLDRIDSVMYCLVVLLIALSAIYGY